MDYFQVLHNKTTSIDFECFFWYHLYKCCVINLINLTRAGLGEYGSVHVKVEFVCKRQDFLLNYCLILIVYNCGNNCNFITDVCFISPDKYPKLIQLSNAIKHQNTTSNHFSIIDAKEQDLQ